MWTRRTVEAAGRDRAWEEPEGWQRLAVSDPTGRDGPAAGGPGGTGSAAPPAPAPCTEQHSTRAGGSRTTFLSRRRRHRD